MLCGGRALRRCSEGIEYEGNLLCGCGGAEERKRKGAAVLMPEGRDRAAGDQQRPALR